MAESTTPQAAVEQGGTPSVLDRMMALQAREEKEQAVAEETPDAPAAVPEAKPEPVEAKPSDELTPEDLPDDAVAEQPVTADEFEIVHDGKQHKLPRAEVIRLAQQGFDYTQKTQAIAERSKAVDSIMARVSEMEQIMPVIANEQAQVAAFRAQLAPYEKVDWVQLATENPLDYPKYRAQYDLLVSGHNQAAQRVSQAMGEYQQRRDAAQTTNLQTQYAKLQELVPEWKDQAKFKAGTQEVHTYLLGQGADPQILAGLSDALAVAVARKAMLYDKLLKSKGDKAKLLQQAPPVTRPGLAANPSSATSEKQQQLANKFKKTRTVEDAAALYLERMK